jgi:hypothetical protein
VETQQAQVRARNESALRCGTAAEALTAW